MSTISASTTTTTAYKVTADTTGALVLQTGATPTTAVTIDTSQNVGIGTSSPNAKLTVDGGNAAIKTGNKLYLWNTSNDNAPYLKHVNGGIGFFNTSDSQAMQTDSSGNLLVGATSGSNKLTVAGNIDMVNTTNILYTNNILCSSSSAAILVRNSTQGVQLTANATSWTSASDENLKTDLVQITNAAEKISSIRAMTGRYKTDEVGVSRAFVIAQDVQAVLPEAVSAIEQNGEKYLGVQYTDVIPLLVAAIQELKAEIDQLKGAA